jgi:signal-transduction protein with cAMP-binding, CBS, and nucleotidyltransferase domain/PAS domain-containing protein
MKTEFNKIETKKFILNIVVPTVLTIVLFIVLHFAFIVPYFEMNMMNGKKELIREIVTMSTYLTEKYHKEEVQGLLSTDEAKRLAKTRIENLRYGIDNKDYVWITDTVPVMVMHPYRQDLNGKDLSDFTDPLGKRLFVDIVHEVKHDGDGYIDYMWQWMDDSTNIVPKISYVKKYEPWGWIIGTGIYIEDVRKEIAGIERILIVVSFGISLIMSLLLTIIVRRNIRVEIQRSTAEEYLRESREKYKVLVEASTEGTLMFLDGKCIFVNKRMKEIVPGVLEEHLSEDLHELIPPEYSEELRSIQSYLRNDLSSIQLECGLSNGSNPNVEVLITLSKIILSEKKGSIVIIRDLRTVSNDDGLIAGQESVIQRISEMKAMGIFKALPGKKGRFVFVNTALVEMLGFDTKEELMRTTILDLIENDDERKEFFHYLADHKKIEGYPLFVRKKTGGVLSLSIYAAVQLNDHNEIDQLSGIVINMSSLIERQAVKEHLLENLLASKNIYYGQVKSLVRNPLYCYDHVSLQSAIEIMDFNDADILLVRSEHDTVVGALSEKDIVKALKEKDFSINKPVREVMNTRLSHCKDYTTISEALQRMDEDHISFLLVQQNDDTMIGILQKSALLEILSADLAMNCSAMQQRTSMVQLVSYKASLQTYVQSLLSSGANVSTITRHVTQCSDEITRRLIAMVIHECGTPPVPFAFITLGSEGREERTLLSDQDNAIIYADESSSSVDSAAYFIRFGKRLNDLLFQAGYELCAGGTMAGNPKWNKSLNVWEQYFTEWITEANPKNIVDINTFFDHRTVYGDAGLTIKLRATTNELLSRHPAFFAQMALECINYKIPLGMFGKLQTEHVENKAGVINIKNASRVIVNIIRLYSMRHNIDETNTIHRLKQLYTKNVFSYSLYRELLYSYEYLLNVQFKHHSYAISKNLHIDNDISLSFLSEIEVTTLKAAFSIIAIVQNKLKQDFSLHA